MAKVEFVTNTGQTFIEDVDKHISVGEYLTLRGNNYIVQHVELPVFYAESMSPEPDVIRLILIRGD